MASNAESDTNRTLASLFEEGLNLFNNLGKIDEPTNSINVQNNVKKAMRLLEEATRLVSIASIFSTNEGIDEVPTEHIQYFLLPALLGSLSLKLTCGERKDIIAAAEVYFKDFLRRCNEYGLSDHKFKEESESSNKSTSDKQETELESMEKYIISRAAKIKRFKEQKELKEKLEVLGANLNNEHVDDEIKRNYYLTLIKMYVYESADELISIDMEKPLLEHMAKVSDKPKPKRPVKPLKPIIITKDEVQKAVFGAGYPSLPTMTVQEFYDKRVKDGIFPDPAKAPAGPLSMQQAALAGVSLNDEEEEDREKEEQVENDDPEYIERMRRKDEYKDDHRRGWGNRMNRS